MGFLIGDNVDKLKDVNIIVAAVTTGATRQQLTVVRGEIQVRRGTWQKPTGDTSPSVALIIPVPPGAKLLQPFETDPAVEVSHKCFPSTQKKVFDDEDDDDDPEAKQAKEDPKIKLAHEKKQVAACFTSALATSNGREDLSKFLTTSYTPGIDHLLYAYYQQCHYVIISWKQIGDIPESITPTDCLLDFQISYLQPITDSILVAPAISFSPTQYQKAAPVPHSRHTPKPRRRVSITSAEGHDADAEDLEQQAALAAVRAEHKGAPTPVRRTSDDPAHHESMAASEDMTAIFDHRIYSVNCVRDDGGKNPEELLENMQYRFASGSFVDIVNASAEYSQVAALLNEQLAHAGSDAKMPVTDASCYRIKRIVGLHPHEDQRMALAM